MVDCSELSQLVHDIAMHEVAEHGIDNIDDLVARMQTHFTDIRRQSLIDYITEVTEGRRRETTELSRLMADIHREAKNDRNLKTQTAALKKHYDEGTLPDPSKPRRESPEAIQELRADRDAMKKLVKESYPARKKLLTEQVNSKIQQLKEVRGNLQGKLVKAKPGRKKRLNQHIAALTRHITSSEQQLKSGDINPHRQPGPTSESRELAQLAYERDKLQRAVRQWIGGLKPKSVFERVADPFNAFRAIMTSWDVSGVGRQGGFVVMSHPWMVAKALGPMFKALASEKAGTKINADILNRPTAYQHRQARLYLSSLDGTTSMASREEPFMSNLAELIPGVRMSERAYLVGLNRIRADFFDYLVATLTINGEPTGVELRAIGNFVNAATGRGSLAGFERAAVALNTLFFSPRYTASRFQLLLGQPLWKGTARTRKLIAGEYARTIGGLGIVYMLSALAGGEIEKEPWSSDFGKIRFGYTRIDPLFGLAQTIAMPAKVFSGIVKSTTTKEIKEIRGDVSFGERDAWDVMTFFLRTKLSPMAATGVDLLVGQHIFGEKITAESVSGRLLMPLVFHDVKESMEEQGFSKGFILSTLAIFGVGIQNHGRVYIETPEDTGEIVYRMTGKKMGERPLAIDRYVQILGENKISRKLATAGLAAYMSSRYGKPKTRNGQKRRDAAIYERIERYKGYIKAKAKNRKNK